MTATDTNVIGSVTINDTRNTPPPEQPVEKKVERTQKQQEEWERVKKKMETRMPQWKVKSDKKDDEKSRDENGKFTKAEDVKADETGKTEEKEKPKKLAPVKKAEPPPPVDVRALATEVATATAKALKEEQKPEKPTDPDLEVPEARRREMPAIRKLEESDPRYKGVTERYQKFAKAEADYVSKWEANNPGARFEPDAEEHSEWYDKHLPAIDDADLRTAEAEVAAERVIAKRNGQASKQTDERIQTLENQLAVERAEQRVPEMVGRAALMVASAMGEPIAKQLTEKQTLEGVDEEAHEILKETIPAIRRQTESAVQIFATNGRLYNSQNPDHVAVATAAKEAEAVILGTTEAERTAPDGRTFVKLDDFAAMTPQQRTQHWTVDADIIALHLAAKASKDAAERYKKSQERLEKWAKSKGLIQNGESKATRQDKSDTAVEQADDTDKERSPSTSNRAVMQPGTKVVPNADKSGGDRLLGRMFRH